MSGLAALGTKRFNLDAIPNLKGRVAVVTGGTAGIGYEIASYLALNEAKVTVIGANEEHGNDTVSEINKLVRENASSGEINFVQCDMHSLKAVDTASKDLLKHNQRLDMLVLNAGIGVAPFQLTSEGKLGNHFAVNNLAHWHMARVLAPLLISTAADTSTPKNSVRVIWQSSELHRSHPSGTKFANKEEVSKEADPMQLYGRSKLGNILSAKEFAKKELKSTGVLSIAVHPGVVSTPQQEGFAQKGAYGKLGAILKPLVRGIAKTPDQGAECALWAATSPDLDAAQVDGQYFSEPNGKTGTESNDAKNDELAANFRQLCESLEAELL